MATPSLAGLATKPTAQQGSPVGGDVFRLGEFQEAVVRALAADARLLHAAERRRRVRTSIPRLRPTMRASRTSLTRRPRLRSPV